MRFYGLILGTLATWRLSHLLWGEDGPWDLLVRLRRAVGNGFWGSLLDCFLCCSLWVAAPFALLLGEGWKERLLLWPAFSAGAILLQGLVFPRSLQPAGGGAPPPALFTEDEENDDVLLRRQETLSGDAQPHQPRA
ncbi:MAG TPA: hypothetical protein VHC97_15210 [Thermoanaerobaculia bacterium]|jgi:hypothetical protein|nr:hypothetical protein [Thermoanaerobaculia bacterium]